MKTTPYSHLLKMDQRPGVDLYFTLWQLLPTLVTKLGLRQSLIAAFGTILGFLLHLGTTVRAEIRASR